MQASQSLGSALTAVPMIGQPDQEKNHTRPIRCGVQLPTIQTPLPYTAKEFEQLDDDISNAEKTYLEYMLLGQYPEGPFFDDLKPCEQHKAMDSLVNKLIDNGQFTALNELLHECDPLYSLNIKPYSFSPDLFSHFLRTISETQPDLRQLMFVVPMSIGLPSDFSEKAETISDFILRSHRIDKFNIVGVDNRFSPKILDAITTVGNATSIDFHFREKLSDVAGEKLRQMISRCGNLQSVYLKGPRLSEEKSAEILHALRNCPKLTELSFSKWPLEGGKTWGELQLLIQQSTTLENFKCSDWFSKQSDVSTTNYTERLDAFSLGIAANKSLKSLSLGPLLTMDRYDYIVSLIRALQKQPTIESLEFGGEDFSAIDGKEGLELLADLVEKNQRIIEIKGLDTSRVSCPDNLYRFISSLERQCATAEKLLGDRLARNRAIASGNLAWTFRQAFFPSPGAPVGSNHIGDPGLYLAEHILRLSPDLPSFEKEMVEIALTIDETAKHEQAGTLETKNPSLPASSST
jgi:hypothetical protein